MKQILLVAALAFTAQSQATEIIATCSNLKGHSYIWPSPLAESSWQEDSITGVSIFTGTNGVIDGLIIRSEIDGEMWTRSAADYGIQVIQIFQEGPIYRVLVPWGSDTELYQLVLVRKLSTN